ncbi:MAG: methylenetetrahydrofolate reductase [NAD(P)H] [Lachnospiraceae bacterium]|jgi:methylenetetrahydrofolate reductase (NADPH)|nr:methylenetetrahydrofolate reductase [NAD(P)H] [Lachnospiraceae bacterium]MCI1726792.1 methylenetetrahydrofolate reductase [NAD(P)H] [Lachnospiraceae bacterium]
MKIRDILSQGRPTLSFEVFPPKTEDKYETVEQAASEIAKLKPDFMSVTYGAGGGTSLYSAQIAATIGSFGVTPLAHLTCVSSTREKVRSVLQDYKTKGIENVLALRGDIPKDGVIENDFTHADELVREIRRNGDFCIGAACYPEGHPESADKADDLRHLKNKVDEGCDFITTQMFFDNTLFYDFLYRARKIGISVPVLAGIMPVTNGKQMKRILELSGCYIPEKFRVLLDRFGDNPAAMKQAGVVYATEQIIDLLAHGVDGIHIYSMNKPDVAEGIRRSLSEII